MKYRFSDAIDTAYRHGIYLLFSLSILFVTFISFINTTMMAPNPYGRYFFLPDSPWPHLLAAVLLITMFAFTQRIPALKTLAVRIETDERLFLLIRRALLLAVGFSAVVWVISSQFIPVVDQYLIQQGVLQIHENNWSLFREGQYFYGYHNNYGLLLLSYLFSLVFGSENYLAFQLINAFALVLLFRELSELCAFFRFSRKAQLGVILAGLVFYPLTLYCSYLYGNIAGLAFALLACRLELQFFREGRTKDVFLCAGSVFMAILVKSNFEIFMVGMLLAAVTECVSTKKWHMLYVPALLILSTVLASKLPHRICEMMSGLTLAQPVSLWGFVAMGLTDTGMAGPGDYNGLNWSLYQQAGFTTAGHAALAKEVVRERLVLFAGNLGEGFRFFSRKLAFEWGDPLFQSYWEFIGLDSLILPADWLQSMISWNGAERARAFLNILQSVTLIGTCIYIILFQNEQSGENRNRLLLPLIFLGGFIFQIFWESGSRYTLLFYVLLLPFSVAGYERAAQAFGLLISSASLKTDRVSRKALFRIRSFVPYLCVMIVGFLLLSFVYRGERREMLSSESRSYALFLQAEDTPHINHFS